MRTRVETAENTIGSISKKATEALKGVKALKNQYGKGGDQESLLDQIEKLNDQLQEHLSEYGTYKDDKRDEMNDMRGSILRKADKIEVEQLQALIQRQL